MTLIIALEGIDFLVLTTDSKGSWEYSSEIRVDNPNAEKLIQLNKHICILIGGDSEIGINLVEEFKTQFTKCNSWTMGKVVKEFSKFCKKEIKHITDTILPGNRMFPAIVFIIGGLEKIKGKWEPKINILRSENLFYPGRKKDNIADGRPWIARYIFGKHYRKDLSLEDMCFLAGKIMSETVSFDGYVGGKIRMAVIDQKGVRKLNDNVVNRFLKAKDEYIKENEKKEKEELEKIIKE